MKYLFVVNPVSGKGHALKNMKALEKKFIEQNFEYNLFETTPEHYAPKLRSIIIDNNYTHVISVGGDGTAHEVLNAIADLDVIYGILPFGTGNDFARVVKLPKKIDKVLEMLKRNKITEIDCGKVNDIYFLNYISFGLDSETAENAEGYKKYFPSATAYVFSVIHTLIQHKNRKVKLNGKDDDIHLVTIHNGKYYGGGMKINPYADYKDGLLDVCTVRKMPKLKILMLFLLIFTGKHTKLKGVTIEKHKEFTIDSLEELKTSIDGEIYKFDLPVAIKLNNKKIKLLCY